MPVYTKDSKRILFIHIPRTGGKSMRSMLQDSQWQKEIISPDIMLSGVSYAHQTQATWNSWGEFDLIFAIVRNPYSRLESQARSRSVRKSEFFPWLKRMKKATTDFRRSRMDNHFLPQYKFIDENVRIFKFEDGYDNIVKELISMKILLKNQSICHIKDRRSTGWKRGVNWKHRNQSGLLAAVNKIYEEDFNMFNYEKIEPK